VRVLHASAEVVPFSKTGGLGDVLGALPPSLASLGAEVLVVTPWYAELGGAVAPYWIGDVELPFAGGTTRVGVGTLELDGVRFAFVGHEDYRRPTLYGYADDVRRFVRFACAVPTVAARVAFHPDVVHAHDWHAALLPALLEYTDELPPGFAGLPSVLTVHNVQFQGVGDVSDVLRWSGLPPELAHSYLQHSGHANLLQAGVGFADLVTTVSPSYAIELTTPAYGFGLDGTFRHLGPKLHGILNGIDTGRWDPATDPWLPARYDATDIGGKARCTAALRTELGLDDGGPILGVVSRLADQKGIDLCSSRPCRRCSSGLASGAPGRRRRRPGGGARRAGEAHPRQVAVALAHDEPLAHRIYAGSDALACPAASSRAASRR
jgi:starch synthase